MFLKPNAEGTVGIGGRVRGSSSFAHAVPTRANASRVPTAFLGGLKMVGNPILRAGCGTKTTAGKDGLSFDMAPRSSAVLGFMREKIIFSMRVVVSLLFATQKPYNESIFYFWGMGRGWGSGAAC